MGLASGGSGEKDISLEAASDADYGIFGVRAERADQPVRPPMVDRQRIYKGGGRQEMGATPRFKNTGGAKLNKAKAGGFKVRKRTLKG